MLPVQSPWLLVDDLHALACLPWCLLWVQPCLLLGYEQAHAPICACRAAIMVHTHYPSRCCVQVLIPSFRLSYSRVVCLRVCMSTKQRRVCRSASAPQGRAASWVGTMGLGLWGHELCMPGSRLAGWPAPRRARRRRAAGAGAGGRWQRYVPAQEPQCGWQAQSKEGGPPAWWLHPGGRPG